MELTGKCKEEFEKWYNQQDEESKLPSELEWFYNFDNSMQWGVYVDYFDTLGIDLISDSNLNPTPALYGYVVRTNPYNSYYKTDCTFKTRSEARTKAIEKANEIRNSQIKN